MRALLLSIALLCGTAHASPPCWPANVGGSGSAIASGSSAYGQWLGWWCPDGQRYGIVGLYSYAIKHPPGPHASIADMLAAYWALNVMAPAEWTQEMRDLDADMAAALDATKPRPPVWRVAPNGTATTRPAYPVADGVIGSKEAGRAPVGQPCDCAALSIKRSTVTYCAAPEPMAALATVCRTAP